MSKVQELEVIAGKHNSNIETCTIEIGKLQT